MKLRNKKTGEIIDDGYVRETHDFQFDGQKHVLAVFKGNGHRPPERVSGAYTSLAELNEEWEDAPEEYWFVAGRGVVEHTRTTGDENDPFDKGRKEIGNYFSSREEAEKAVEKLKAWKRLKDKGFAFEGWDNDIGDNYYKTGQIVINLNNVKNRDWDEYVNIDEIKEYLDLLFGGEE